jgi:hypothetical protein
VKFDTLAISTLSEKVKRVMTDSQTWMNQSKILLQWLNSTMHNQTTVFTCVRQLEFAIIHLQRQIQGLTNGLKFIFLGKFPINLIYTSTLYSILRNVSALPEDYSLFAGLNYGDTSWRYEYSKCWCMQTIIHLE